MGLLTVGISSLKEEVGRVNGPSPESPVFCLSHLHSALIAQVPWGSWDVLEYIVWSGLVEGALPMWL